MNNVMLCLIDSSTIYGAWNAIVPLIAPAVKKANEFTFEQVYTKIEQDEFNVLAALDESKAIKLVCVYCVDEHPNGRRVMNLVHVGGEDLKEYFDPMLDTIKEIAKKFECTAIRGNGRKGWLKLLPDAKEVSTIFEIEV